ncbi:MULTISPECIES: 1-acyl-sn-glycerol-3-phosphate acyltransferase [unclassified Massilia]|uniref:lysophospholipid acyltransferase family protein n=1 Tax=unclassified Massilia TaxID=2609279 RepID=UPI001594C83D|nr:MULTISPECIES: lysophospholipid acyltransferase family protein [unclassified Massilia]NVD98924.1 1-acyl-sn-glycerol-3-phosphate acyltransferase [Massilia sp. BJB1822]UTY57921.1 1-acyl-sn-glycerol-3-phosphate acyltransferase [Massilia sp. erpn]
MRKAVLFLRSLLFMVLMGIATVIWSAVCMLVAPLPYNKRYYVTSRWNVFIVWCAKTICGIEYEFKGYENFPDSPAIILSKHQSAWETIFLLANLPRPLVFVFKKEILYIPFFGWGIALLRMIPIDRKQGKNAFKSVVAHGKRRLKDGQWIIMFPEGTRIPVGKAGKYKSGGTRLAIETGAPVVPIALNSGECWPKNSFIKYPGKITVSVGKPIASDGHTPDSLMEQVEQWIESEMRVISPHAYNAG